MDKNLHSPGEIGLETARALQNNGFKAAYFATAGEALDHLETLVPAGATVGFGGSQTLQTLGVRERLTTRGNNTLYNHRAPGLTREKAMKIRRKQIVSDVFITGTNAITRDGMIVNTDGTGNRVAAMIFGPKRTIIVAGINKITENLSEAKKRIEQIAAPLNNKRLAKPNPCVETGRCMDCQEPTRICNVTTILKRCPTAIEIQVILVGETLGF